MSRIGRFARTVLPLEWPQIGGQLLRPLGVRVFPPLLARGKQPLSPPAFSTSGDEALAPLRTFAESERLRYAGRAPRLVGKLAEFERSYGLEAGADGGGQANRWNDATAFHPFCASVRARRLAVALTCGASRDFFPDLVQAARAVFVQPEIHLLGNHFLENGIGLLASSTLIGGLEGAAFRTVGQQILERELPRQFLPDGAHAERSISYHLHLIAALLEVFALLSRTGQPVPSTLGPTIRKGLSFAAAVRAPDGSYPLFNDASLDAAPSIDEALALGQALGFATTQPRDEPLRSFRDSGLCIASAGEYWLAFDVGEDGYREQPGHVHADALTFELFRAGVRSVVDYGVGSYAIDPERVRTRATRSHNTVEMNDENSAEVWSAFRTGRFSNARLVAVTTRPSGVTITGEHAGYRYLRGSPRHLRTLALTAEGLHVTDQWTGAPAQVVSRLRVDEEAPLKVSGSTTVLRSPGVWFPRFRDSRPAICYEQRAGAHERESKRLEWRIR